MRDVPHDGETLGEIVARGNVVMRGTTTIPRPRRRRFSGGWFHTGDAAVVHPDGYMQIRDRFKDVIISGGENISSIEVEGRAAAPSLRCSKSRWSECRMRSGANRRTRSSCCARAPPLRRRIASEFARGDLAHFKVPTAFHFVSELPKTATGKIQKFVLRKGAAAISAQ